MIKLLSLVTVLLFATNSYAATIFFGENQSPGGTVSGDPLTARTLFLSNLTAGVSTEDFETFPPGNTGPLGLTFSGSGGDINADLTNLTGSGRIGFTSSFGRFATSGTDFWEADGSFAVTFDSAIAAFGFYGTDIGDFNGTVTVDLLSGETKQYNINHTVNGNDASLLFWGIIDTTNLFTKVTFGNTSAGADFFGFDDLTVGDITQVSVIPVPAAIWLFGTALIGLVGFGRRRKSV